MSTVAKPKKKKLTNNNRLADKKGCRSDPSPGESKMIHRIDAESLATWAVPVTLVTAEEQFEQLLPSLLPENEHCWVFVTHDSAFQVFDSFDEADIAAEESGYITSQYVVRQVSLSELLD